MQLVVNMFHAYLAGYRSGQLSDRISDVLLIIRSDRWTDVLFNTGYLNPYPAGYENNQDIPTHSLFRTAIT